MEYLSEDQLVDLAERLRRLTVEKKISWNPVAGSMDYAFATTVKNTGFTIKSRDNDDFAPHTFGVFSVSNVGSQPPKLLQDVDTSVEGVELGEALDALYQTVKRTTLKVDTVARDVFNALDELD